jgi:RNA polymerase sigma factor (sigma-70 family)
MQSADERPSATDDLRSRLDARFRGPLMSFFLRRIKNRAEAEDLTQEVFVRLIGSAGLSRIEDADAFIFKVAANLLLDRHRRDARRSTPGAGPFDEALVTELTRELIEDRGPERVLLSQESLADALKTLGELGERTRDIFILFRLENMKQRDIAALYGIAQSTVEKHVCRAVLHLATRYGRGTRE